MKIFGYFFGSAKTAVAPTVKEVANPHLVAVDTVADKNQPQVLAPAVELPASPAVIADSAKPLDKTSAAVSVVSFPFLNMLFSKAVENAVVSQVSGTAGVAFGSTLGAGFGPVLAYLVAKELVYPYAMPVVIKPTANFVWNQTCAFWSTLSEALAKQNVDTGADVEGDDEEYDMVENEAVAPSKNADRQFLAEVASF